MKIHHSFIKDLIDEGYLDSNKTWRYYMRNPSEIGEENLKLYNPTDGTCSVNQSFFSGWRWLTGIRMGTLEPLLCVGMWSGICEDHSVWRHSMSKIEIAEFIWHIVFALANLLALAVWFRCKKTLVQASQRRQVGIQLLLLRLFSVLGIVECISRCAVLKPKNDTLVMSIPHAVLLALYRCAVYTVYWFTCQSATMCSLLAAVFLVEYSHPAQRVLICASRRRVLIALAIGVTLFLPWSMLPLLTFGSYYCRSNGDAPAVLDSYRLRISIETFRKFYTAEKIEAIVILVLSAILLIVHASKRCCACCRGADFSAWQTTTVSYQLHPSDTTSTTEDQTEAAVVLSELGDSSPGLGLADELRRLIFWQQVTLVFSQIVLRGKWYMLEEFSWSKRQQLLLELVGLAKNTIRVAAVPILAVVLSPTFRRGILSIFTELKNAPKRFCRPGYGIYSLKESP